ncbi:DNA primase [Desulfurella amilsii]|uniref:DNA primase n=1 Tax=Desulfurella amilsii TaxID=1562698 RepID=A0A1X4Y062_9BACT|nr:DNA primase [Desulfurella amilsii]OSS43160.1 DNA primase [Desulfurella amilsii]
MNLVEEIKSRLDIVDFINRYINLKKSGNNYIGLCPFHSEKTPSFTVNKEKQFFHCFGCGESGDVITFYMKIENLDFKEAIKNLALQLGLEINSEDESTKKENLLFDVNKFACEFFQKKLKNSDFAQNYLEKRQIKQETQEVFQLGYNPNDNSLVDFLLKKYSIKLLNESGIVSNAYNIFAGRLMFPISDEYGKIVGFAGRALHDNQKAKYINTKETAIFLKQRLLYGFDKAKTYTKDYLIVCEGYFDCIRLYQEGLQCTSATMGTNLSDYHIRLIKRYTDKIYFNFDSDEAGINAMLKNTKVLGQLDAYVVEFSLNDTQKEDPDSFVMKYSIQEYKKLLQSAKDYFSFLEEKILKQHNLQNARLSQSQPISVASAINAIKNAIDNISDSVLKSLYYSKARRLLNLNIVQKNYKSQETAKKTYTKSHYIISYLLKDPFLLDWIEDKEEFAKNFDVVLKEIFFKLTQNKDVSFEQFVSTLDKQSASMCYELYLLTQEESISQKRANFLMLMNTLELEKLKKQMHYYLKRIAEDPDNEELKESYRQTKNKLQRLKNE